MSRAGLTPERVVEVAAELMDTAGAAPLSLAAVAERLGVRPPSLYSHVGGLEELRRAVGLGALARLSEACRAASMGRSGDEALRAIAHAYRTIARAHPGTYALTQVAHPDDGDWQEASARVLEPITAALRERDLSRTEAIHAVRTLRSALHGFVLLEIGGGFGLDVSTKASFERLVDAVLRGLPRG